MAAAKMFDRAIDLSNRVLGVTSGLDLARGDHWSSVVTVLLVQANERLDSLRVLLDRGYWDSGVILTRSLFEITVNLAYLARNPSERVPEYLKHGGIAASEEEAKALQEELERGGETEANDIVPGQAWRRLKDMCCDLGSEWLKEYETFYRYASVPTHAGSFTLGTSYKQLLEQQPPSDHDKASVIVTALAFHLRVAEIAATVLPPAIDSEVIDELRGECRELGRALTGGGAN